MKNSYMFNRCIICLLEIFKTEKQMIPHDAFLYMYIFYNQMSCNEILRNSNCCVINPVCHYMQWIAICAGKSQFLSLYQLLLQYCERWWNADGRQVRFRGSGTIFGEYFVIRVLWNVTKLTLGGRTDWRFWWKHSLHFHGWMKFSVINFDYRTT